MTLPVYDKPNPKFDYDTPWRPTPGGWSRARDGWKVIDLHTVMKKSLAKKREMDPKFKYSRDGVHPEEGHELMAQQIIDFFAVKPPSRIAPQCLRTHDDVPRDDAASEMPG